MDCIYYPSFNNNNNYINIEHTFTNHLKALRIRLGDSLLITNGQGLLVKTTLMNEDKQSYVFKIIDKIEDAIKWSDAIILLRLQRERMESGFLPTLREYSQYMGLTYSLFSKKPGLIVLHPGPVNYGIELDYNVSAYPNVLIQTQVKHGLFIRMGLLSLLTKNYRERTGS